MRWADYASQLTSSDFEHLAAIAGDRERRFQRERAAALLAGREPPAWGVSWWEAETRRLTKAADPETSRALERLRSRPDELNVIAAELASEGETADVAEFILARYVIAFGHGTAALAAALRTFRDGRRVA